MMLFSLIFVTAFVGNSHRAFTSGALPYEEYAESEWLLVFTTGTAETAGTDDRVHFQMFGADGNTAIMDLASPEDDFERGVKDHFQVISLYAGAPLYIKLSIMGSDGWFLETLEMTWLSNSDQKFVFSCFCWLNDSETKILYPTPQNPVDFQVTVVTGNHHNDAGTVNPVYIRLINGDETSPPYRLKNEGQADFEKGKTAVFPLTIEDIGQPSHVEVTVEGDKQGWYLSKITLKNLSTNKTSIARCYQWFNYQNRPGTPTNATFPLIRIYATQSSPGESLSIQSSIVK